ncbi:MAG: STY0301 family protein [Alphaproteobacteria bacterium]
MSKKLSAIICLIGMFFAHQGTAAEAEADANIRCPAVLKSFVALEESASMRNWLLGGPRQTYTLKGGRVFVGRLTEESIQPAAEVKPIPHVERMEEKKVFFQVWNLEAPAFDNVLLICDYSGTDNYLIYALDAKIKKCAEIVPVTRSDGAPSRVECQ